MAANRKQVSAISVRLALLMCVTVGAVYSQDMSAGDGSPRTGYACEGSTLTISCPDGWHISIQRANYGRFNPLICNEHRNPTDSWDLQCMSTRSLNTVTQMCDGRATKCQIQVTNRLFGDPCSLTPKYLEVQYRCESPQPVTQPPTRPPTRVPDVFDEEHHPPTANNDAQSPETSSPSTTTSTSTTKSSTTVSSSVATSGQPVNDLELSRTTPPLEEIDVVAGDEPQPPQALTERYCDERKDLRHVFWPKTAAGALARVPCPNNGQENEAVWQCGSDPVEWVGTPDLSRCVSPAATNIKSLADDTREQFSAERLEEFAEDLEAFTEMQEEVFGGDLAEITAAMQEVVDQIDEHIHDLPLSPGDVKTDNSSRRLVQKVNDAVLTTSSYLLDEERKDSWMDLPQATQAETATRLISTVENSAQQLAKMCVQPTIIVNVTVNIVLEINVMDVGGTKPVEDVIFPRIDSRQPNSWKSNGDSIRLTGDTIRELGVDGLAKVIFATYANIDRYLRPQSDDSNLMALSARPTSVYRHYDIPSDDQSGQRYRPNNPWDDAETHTVMMDEDVDEKKRQDSLKGKDVNSRIISATIGERDTSHQIPLKEPVIYTLEHQTTDNVFNPSCAFWEFSEKSLDGKWSTFGCEIVETNITHTTCACQHLTNFAVLMSVRPVERNVALEILTYFGLILSLVCLLASFITFVAFKNLQSDRNTIHKNLVASLFAAELLFLIGIWQFQDKLLCSIFAGFLHYLFLCAFMWMCLEGIQIYVMLVEVFEVERSRVGWYYAAGYGIPAIIVAVSAAVFPGGYGTASYCWLSVERGFVWSFVGPACAILLVNAVMLSIAIYVMCRHSSTSWKTKEQSTLENISSYIKGAVVLIVLLGLTWIFGLFYVNNDLIFMAYVFVILNSLQGVFIFIFHCLMNDKVLKEYKRWVRHTSWLPSNLRIRCGGTKATTPSSTPNNSSTSGVNRVMSQQKISLEYLTKLITNRQRKRLSTSTLPSTTNVVKRNGYTIHRNSSGRESAHLTDSGIACGDGTSHIYSEATTEDPAAYLDPVRIRLDPDEETYWRGCEMSQIEGSIADTDYLDNYGQRHGPGGINIDKYVIRPPPPSCPLPAVPHGGRTESGALQKTQQQPIRYHPYNTTNQDMYRSDDSLLRKKLLAMGETLEDFKADEENGGTVDDSSVCSSRSTLMNNLNKCSSIDDGSLDGDGVPGGGGGQLSAPNIAATPSPASNSPHMSGAVPTRDHVGRVNRALAPTLQRSLPSLYQPVTVDCVPSTQCINFRQGHAPYSASVGCTLDALSDDVNFSHHS